MSELSSVEQRFISKVEISENGCWVWQGGMKEEYGQFWYHGYNHFAHRISYILFIGEIPTGYNICHTCDVKLCVNPLHLFLGTQSDNIRDMIAKGRRYDNSGENHPECFLSDSEVLEIISLYKSGKFTQKTLAEMYGVCQKTISYVIRGRTRRKMYERSLQ